MSSLEHKTHELADITETINKRLSSDEARMARDWAGFFEALAKFAAAIMPLILPLFANVADDKK